MAKVLNTPTSQLLMPGPRITVLAELPTVPTAGIWKTSALKLRLNVCSLLGSTGLPVTTIRALWLGVPVTSTPVTELQPTPSGVPLTTLGMAEICQPVRTAFATGFCDGLAGISQIALTFSTCVRSNDARP